MPPVEEPPAAFVSTGTLPRPLRVQELVDEAYARFRSVDDGAVSAVYPALQRVPPERFGLSVASVAGATYDAGDAEVAHPIMSVAKPFAFALACDLLGADEASEVIGANATGLAFNEPEAILRSPDGRTNPMVNPGAIATVSHLAGAPGEGRWEHLREGLSAFAGRGLDLDEEVLESALRSNHRNRELTALLAERGRLGCEPDVALELYTRQCSLAVTAHDLAVMGATLADGGVNPVTGERVVTADACRTTLAAMATAGLYETTGDWLTRVGLPGKSGVGGSLVTVSPGKGALGTYAPLLDEAGNSVKGQLAASFLARALGMDLFLSEPAFEHGSPPG